MKIPGVVAVLCVVSSGMVLHIGITSCTFPPWTEMSKKNGYANANAMLTYFPVPALKKAFKAMKIFVKFKWQQKDLP